MRYLLQFTESGPVMPEALITGNHERRKREISKQMRDNYHIKASYEKIKESITKSKKSLRKEAKKQNEEQRDSYKLQLKREKRKEKHPGH
jgi:hypothetical protein